MSKEALQQEISLFDFAYEQGNPLISDTEYEKKISELKKMEAESGAIPDSPTQVIPFIKVEGLETIPHNTPILSMDKVTDFPALFRWYRAGEGVLIEPKLDGLTIVLRYSNGQLVDAITRGNGLEGERVLHTVQTIKNLPKTISYGGELEIRGEVYIPFAAFNKVNNGEYANPRSMVAGTVRLLDPNEAFKRGLDIQIFDLLHCDLIFETAVQQYRFLWEQGFPVVPFDLFFDKLSIEKYITKYEHETRGRLPFPIDGVCVKYNELSLREKMGVTGKFPRHSMAFKFASLEEFTTLREVTWQIGKSGQLTPVANFDTITIDGVEINKATLHNFEFIQEKQIALNSKIVVARANDVIPKVVCAYPTDETTPILPPDECPICGGLTKLTGPNLYCTNQNCEGRLIEQIIHYCSRDALDIEGMGESAVKTFFENGFITNTIDLYSLKHKAEEIKTLEGYGEKSISKILASIEESKTKPFERVLYALNIPYLGRTNSRILLEKYFSIDEISQCTAEGLAQLDGIGEITARAIVDWFADNQPLIDALKDSGVNMTAPKPIKSDSLPLAGQIFVLTGTMSLPRSEIEALIREKGGTVSGSVSKKTNYLVAAPGESGTTKYQKAQQLGVAIIGESELMELGGV